jgi:hypothetical protein
VRGSIDTYFVSCVVKKVKFIQCEYFVRGRKQQTKTWDEIATIGDAYGVRCQLTAVM